MWEAVSDGRTSCSEFPVAARRAPPTFNGLFVRDRTYEKSTQLSCFFRALLVGDLLLIKGEG